MMLPGRIGAGLAAPRRKREVEDLARRLTECEGKMVQGEPAAGSHKPSG